MLLLGFILSFVGLVLDIFGVAKIFLLKVGPFRELPNLNIGGLMSIGSYNSDNKIDFLKKSIDSTFEKFNRENSKNDKRANKFFLIILIGFILQLVGLFISNINVMSNYCNY